MGSEHLPAISQSDQDNRDRFWAATRSKFVHRADDKETKLDETKTHRNRGAFTRRLPPLASKIPVKASPDSGYSDPSHFDESFSKPNLPGSLEESSLSHAKDAPPNQLTATQNPIVNASTVKDSPSSHPREAQKPIVSAFPAEEPSSSQLKATKNPFDTGFDKPDTPQRTYQQYNQLKAQQQKVDLQIGLQTFSHLKDTSLKQPKEKAEVEDSAQNDSNVSDSPLGKKKVSEVAKTSKIHLTDRPKHLPEQTHAYLYNPSAEKEPLRLRSQSEKVSSKSKLQLEKPSTESVPQVPKSMDKSEPPVKKVLIKNEPRVQQTPITSESQTEQAPIRSEPQSQQAPIRGEPQAQQAPIKSKFRTQQAPIRSEPRAAVATKKKISAVELVTIFPMRTKPTQSKLNAPAGKASNKTSLPAKKTPLSNVTAAAAKPSVNRPNNLTRSVGSTRRYDETRRLGQDKTHPVRRRKVPVRQVPVGKKAEVKVDSRMRRAPASRKPPLLPRRNDALNTRNRNNAANRSRKERIIFDRRGNLVLRNDRPPPPPPSKRPRRLPLRPPRPEDLRRRYLGREAPRRARPAPPLSGPRPQLSRREAGQWRRVHRKFGAEPTARRRVTRHDRYLQRVERVQLEAALRHNEALAEMTRRRERSKWRQAAQLWKVRDRFREEKQERWRRQWMTPKTTRSEVPDRHLYGLPEDELAPVLEAPERPRRAPIERFDYAERRRVNLQRYAAHLGLDRQDRQPWDRGDARMPRVRPSDRPPASMEPCVRSDRAERHQDVGPVRKPIAANSKMQDDRLEISGTQRGDREQAIDDKQNTEQSRDRRIYQVYPQGQKPQNMKEKRPIIPITTRTTFAAKLTARNAQKPRDQANETKRQRKVNNQEQLSHLAKREKALGSVTSLRTVDFLNDEPEVDTLDAFDKARIKYNIEIDSLPEDDDS